MKDACCKDCPDREPGCHGRCERYKAWKKKDEDEKAWLKKQKMDYGSQARKQAIITKAKRKARGWK